MNITDLSKAILTDQYLNQIKNAAFTAVSNYEKTHSILEANRAALKEALIAISKMQLPALNIGDAKSRTLPFDERVKINNQELAKFSSGFSIRPLRFLFTTLHTSYNMIDFDKMNDVAMKDPEYTMEKLEINDIINEFELRQVAYNLFFEKIGISQLDEISTTNFHLNNLEFYSVEEHLLSRIADHLGFQPEKQFFIFDKVISCSKDRYDAITNPYLSFGERWVYANKDALVEALPAPTVDALIKAGSEDYFSAEKLLSAITKHFTKIKTNYNTYSDVFGEFKVFCKSSLIPILEILKLIYGEDVKVKTYDDIITNMYIPVGGGIEILYTKNNEVKFKLPEETTTRGGVTIKTSELRALLNEILLSIKA